MHARNQHLAMSTTCHVIMVMGKWRLGPEMFPEIFQEFRGDRRARECDRSRGRVDAQDWTCNKLWRYEGLRDWSVL